MFARLKSLDIEHLSNDGVESLFSGVKNSLNNPLYFGNVNKHKIREVISSESFQKLWHANPDKISGLRDSALRYATFLTADLEEDDSGLFHIKAPLFKEKNIKV